MKGKGEGWRNTTLQETGNTHAVCNNDVLQGAIEVGGGGLL